MREYFTLSEFDCPCCHKHTVSDELIKLLNYARGVAGVPFVITSGYRCPEHNKAVGGVENSAHVKGLAADIACGNSTKMFVIVSALLRAGFKRIGLSSNGFIHVDIDETKPQNVIWLYK